MAFFDIRTAYLIMGLLYFCMPIAIWLALRDERSTAVHQWCSGGLLFGLGLFFLGLRGFAPDWVSYELMSLCMNAGHLLRVAALHRELQRPLGLHWQAGLLSLFLLLYELGRWLQPQGPLYYQLSLGFLAFYFCWIALLATALAQQQRLRSAYWLGGAYLPLGLLVLVQLLRAGLAPMHPLQPDWGVIALALMGNVSAVIGNTSFMGLYVERATRRQLTHAVEQTRAAENLRLGRQIAHLDRVRGLGMVSASLAHELSQPLSSLSLTAEQARFELASAAATPGRTQAHLDNILRDARHARGVLQRIRSFITTGETAHGPVSLQDVHRDVLSLLKEWFQTERVQVTVAAPATPLRVRGDAVQLAQILVNVYRNAIEACAAQAERRIHATLDTHQGLARIAIHDNGPGFSPQALARSREGFFSSKPEGLGVGLMISSQIAEMHQGRLRLDNPDRGGACVTLQLPILGRVRAAERLSSG